MHSRNMVSPAILLLALGVLPELSITQPLSIFQPGSPTSRRALPGPKALNPSKNAPSQQQLQAAKLFAQAAQAQRSGKIKVAIGLYQQTLKTAPDAFPAWMNLALCYQAARDNRSAITALKKAMALMPKDPTPVIQITTIYLQENKPGEALPFARKAVGLSPNNPQTHFFLGGCEAALKHYATAEDEYRQCIRLKPDNAQAHFNLGYTLIEQKKESEAVLSFTQAWQLDHRMLPALANVAFIQQQSKNYPLAIETWKKITAYSKDNFGAWFNLGICYQLESDKSKNNALQQEAITAYIRCLALQPKYAPAHVNVARLYYIIGNYSMAVIHFNDALALQPNNPRLLADTGLVETTAAAGIRDPKIKAKLFSTAEVHIRKGIALGAMPQHYAALGFLFDQQSLPDKAAKVCEEWTARFPKDKNAWMALAKEREIQKKDVDAETAWRKAIELAPTDPSPRLSLAAYLDTQKKTDQAVAIYKQMQQDLPKNVEARRQLGMLYLRSKKTSEAIAEFDSIKRIAPDEKSAYMSIANAYEQDGKYEEAMREYRALVKMNPNDVFALASIARNQENQKKLDDALATYSVIGKLLPKDTYYTANIPRILTLQNKTEEAVAAYRSLVLKDPKNTGFLSSIASLYEKKLNWQQAADTYKEAIKADPSNTWMWRNIGNALHNLKKNDEAIAAYQKALQDPSQHVTAYEDMHKIYIEINQEDKYIAWLKDRLTKQPSDKFALLALESAENNLKKTEELLSFMKELSVKNASNIDFLSAYAALLARNGRQDDANIIYVQAAHIQPDNYGLRQTAAIQLVESGKSDQAIILYNEILQIKNVPKVHIIGTHFALADIYLKQNKKPNAAAQYQEILKLDPKNVQAADGLKKAGG